MRHVYAIVGINCDGYCHPTTYSTGIRHWLAWGQTDQPVPGVAEQAQPDHAECGKLAAESIVGVPVAAPDNATAYQLAAAINALGLPGVNATVTGSPIATIVGTAPVKAYNCWPADFEVVDLSACHNPMMPTVIVTKDDVMNEAQAGAVASFLIRSLQHLGVQVGTAADQPGATAALTAAILAGNGAGAIAIADGAHYPAPAAPAGGLTLAEIAAKLTA